jgi:hypothetical protein
MTSSLTTSLDGTGKAQMVKAIKRIAMKGCRILQDQPGQDAIESTSIYSFNGTG